MKKLALIILLFAVIPASASARYYGGSHVSVGFGYGYGYPYYAPAYPAYYPAPVYYEPAPVVVEEVRPYGNYARPAPPPVVYDNNGYCREYSQNIVVDGRTVRGYGTTCRQPDGSWRVVTPAQ